MLFDSADCFPEPTGSKYKESAVYDCLEFRSVEREILYVSYVKAPSALSDS